MKPGKVRIEVTCGHLDKSISLYIGDEDTGHRLAGGKPWGGCHVIHAFEVDVEELIKQANLYGYPSVDEEEE